MPHFNPSILLVIVKLEDGKVTEELRHVSFLHGEGIKAATLFLGGPAGSPGPIYETAYLGHLQQFILLGGGNVLQHLGKEFGPYPVLDGLQYLERLGNGRFAYADDIAHPHHVAGF